MHHRGDDISSLDYAAIRFDPVFDALRHRARPLRGSRHRSVRQPRQLRRGMGGQPRKMVSAVNPIESIESAKAYLRATGSRSSPDRRRRATRLTDRFRTQTEAQAGGRETQAQAGEIHREKGRQPEPHRL